MFYSPDLDKPARPPRASALSSILQATISRALSCGVASRTIETCLSMPPEPGSRKDSPKDSNKVRVSQYGQLASHVPEQSVGHGRGCGEGGVRSPGLVPLAPVPDRPRVLAVLLKLGPLGTLVLYRGVVGVIQVRCGTQPSNFPIVS